MARPEGLLLVALATSCTAFNGRTLHATDDAGGTGCGCASVVGAFACEDFEGTTLAAPWSATGDNLPSTDATHAHCGKSSLYIHVPEVPANQEFVSAVTENATFTDSRFASGFFVRAYIRVSGDISSPNYVPLFEARQTDNPFLGIAAQIGHASAALTDWTSTPVVFNETSTPFPHDEWACVEWQVAFSASNGTSSLWINSAPPLALPPTNTQPSPPYAAIFAGAYVAGVAAAQSPFDLWIDDLVISGQRIGCD